MDTEEYRKKIELEIFEIIEEKLKSYQMNAKERKRSLTRFLTDSALLWI